LGKFGKWARALGKWMYSTPIFLIFFGTRKPSANYIKRNKVQIQSPKGKKKGDYLIPVRGFLRSQVTIRPCLEKIEDHLPHSLSNFLRALLAEVRSLMIRACVRVQAA
jgi:hypothetical protein